MADEVHPRTWREATEIGGRETGQVCCARGQPGCQEESSCVAENAAAQMRFSARSSSGPCSRGVWT